MRGGRLWQAMQLHYLVEGRFVKCAPHDPSLVAIAEQIALAEIFNPNQAFRRIMKINLRRSNFVRLQKLRDFDVVAILFPLEVIFDQDKCLFSGTSDSIELSIRAAFFNWRDLHVIDCEPREMHPSLAKQP